MKKKRLKVLSLFDGIATARYALKKLRIRCRYYASEIHKPSIQVAQKNFSKIRQLGDVEDWLDWELPNIDLLIGGSPCQGFSVAGKRLNFDDPRSGLFFTFVDILKKLRPKYFLLENVRMKGEWLAIISEYMGVQPIHIDSADFSAQQRKRCYWTNIPVVPPIQTSPVTVEDILEDEVSKEFIIEPKRAVKLLEDEVKRRKIAFIGSDSQANRIYRIHGKSVTLCGDAGGLGAKTGLYALPCITPDRIKKSQNGRRFKPPSSKFYTLTATDKHGIFTDNFIRKLTPLECERLQTLPDNYTNVEGLSPNARYKMLGNGFTASVIQYLLSFMDLGKEYKLKKKKGESNVRRQ